MRLDELNKKSKQTYAYTNGGAEFRTFSEIPFDQSDRIKTKH